MKIFNIIEVAPLKMKQQTNIIGEGVVFSKNQCAVNWTNKKPGRGSFSNMAFFDSIEHIYELYNDIQIVFLNHSHSNIHLHESELIKNGKFVHKRGGALAFDECFSSNANHMCSKCDCWKKTRLECS
jgi:hypothetical protein